MKSRAKRRFSVPCLLGAAVVACAVAVLLLRDKDPGPSEIPNLVHSPNTLEALLSTAPKQIGTFDVAILNLLCAQGLPGAEDISQEVYIRLLDSWAKRVRTETERHLYRFRARPAEFENSEAYFRMLMMAVVLYEDCSIRYNPDLISSPGETGADTFFSDSRDLFLHGLCGERRMGTCSSMPVLYVAIGRRLGYPLKLATTKAHLFLRWDSPAERFNLEATGKGMNRYDDEHFKRWPYPVSEEEIRTDGYLKSLSPTEELALFLSLRGNCLKSAGRYAEAAAAYSAATRFAPDARPYQLLLSGLSGAHFDPAPPLGRPEPAGAALVPDPNPLLQNR